MNRRNFIKSGTVAGISIPLLSIFSCTLDKSAGRNKQFSEDHFELAEITIDNLQQEVATGRCNYRSIVQLYLDRIRQIDKSGPCINSIIELNPDALSIAEAMDKERKAGHIRSRLHGIPVLIKDNIDTADKMQTTAGSLALSGNYAPHDAFLVKKLRDAGAVILGKTNLSEWANFRSTRSVSGWSSRGGQTKNPYILDRSPCGSSSGSAVAVATNLCMVAIGTETDGSIACPSSMNGIVGIKPTVGLVSRSGIIPISKTQDTAGPMARTVTDTAILLGVISGADEGDAATLESRGKSETDYTRFLNMNGMRGKRIGIEKTMLHRHEAVDALLNRTLEQMRNCGAEIEEVEFMSNASELGDAELKVLEYEFKAGLNHYLASANCKLKTLEQVIAYDKQHESTIMPYFKQEIFEIAQAKKGLDSKDYQTALSKCRTLRKYLDNLMDEQRLDAICGPATGPPWCTDLINGDFWTGYGAYTPAAITGYPSVTVPMGLVDGLPVGISFIGKAYSEAALLSIAYVYEQTSKNRTIPEFIETFKSKK
jgi:amidase